MPRHAHIDVDLDAIAANAAAMAAAAPGAELCAVVKADGYGHGAVGAARAALAGGATSLAVALVEEGAALRAGGIEVPILVLSEPPADVIREAFGSGLTPTLYTTAGIDAAHGAVQRSGGDQQWTVHLKVDTGMHRVGAHPVDVPDLARRIATTPTLHLGGTFTHLAVADEPERPETAAQLDRFAVVLDELTRAGIDPGRRHAANSAGALAHRRSHLDMIRAGIALYGIPPAAELRDRVDLVPAMSLRSEVTMVKDLVAGDGVSYGLRHVFDRPSTVAIVPLGYTDGVPRRLGLTGGEVLIGGARRTIRGVVTMDQLIVEVTDGPPVRPGDPVVLLGVQGDEQIDAQEWADRLDTIAYEVVCGFSRGCRGGSGRCPPRPLVTPREGEPRHRDCDPDRGVGSLGSPDAMRPGLQAMSHPLVTTTGSVDDTRALAAALAELARPGDLLLLVGDLGAGKTAFTQGFGAGLGIDEQITSPTFAFVRGYTGRLDLNHLDVYRLEQINEALDLGLSELLDDGSVTIIEWGDTITQALPRDYLEVRITFGEGDEDRIIELAPVGSRWQAGRVHCRSRSPRGRCRCRPTELVTERAIGADPRNRVGNHPDRVRHRWARGRPGLCTLGQGKAPRREPDAGDRVHLFAGPGGPVGDRAGGGRRRPGSVHRTACRHRDRQGDGVRMRVPMIGVSSLDLLAFPMRFSPRLIVAAIDARRGEIFYSFYRQVPGGVQRISDHAIGSPDDLASELLATGEEALLVGDGAHRYREDFDGLRGSGSSTRATASPRPPRWCSWRTPGRSRGLPADR